MDQGPQRHPRLLAARPASGRIFVDGWFRTGDAAWRDEDGFYYLVDRFKDMYKSGGENVAPTEVERALSSHPDVVDVASSVCRTRSGARSARRSSSCARARTSRWPRLRAYCATLIAKYKAPRSPRVVDELPRNTTGKIVKARLRELS